MRDIINRVRGSSAPSLNPQQGAGHGATSSTAAAFTAVSTPATTVSPPGPPIPRSTAEGAVGLAPSAERTNEGGWGVGPGDGAIIGNPLAGLMGSLGSMGGAGGGGGGGGGLLAELLGVEDEARLKKAVEGISDLRVSILGLVCVFLLYRFPYVAR